MARKIAILLHALNHLVGKKNCINKYNNSLRGLHGSMPSGEIVFPHVKYGSRLHKILNKLCSNTFSVKNANE